MDTLGGGAMSELEFLDDAIREWEEILGKVEARLASLRMFRTQIAEDDAALGALRERLAREPDVREELSKLFLVTGLRLAKPTPKD
jgi:hypothetical protein